MLPLAIGLAGLVPTLLLAWRTRGLTRGFDEVPIHFDWRMRPDAYGPPWVMWALLPVIQLGMLVFLAVVPRLGLPTHGDAETGLIAGNVISGAAFAFSQGLMAFLLRRWRDTL